MKTDDLIGMLSQDAAVGRGYSTILAAAMVAGIAGAALLFAMALPMRSNLMEMMDTPRVAFKFGTAVLLAVSAFGLVGVLGRPGIAGRGWSTALAAMPALILIAIASELAVSPSSDWMALLVGHNAIWCLTFIPMLAAGPLALLLLALRQGAPGNPGLAGAAAGLCASGIASTLYAMHCVDDSPLFVAAWYGLATLGVTVVGFLLGRSLLRW
ncbi:MAG: DUF1109 domain-containing protein [Rhizobiaceae bacterium]|nr:DUF1109 domain-containing protein [Rhizobiaceae bacterium]